MFKSELLKRVHRALRSLSGSKTELVFLCGVVLLCMTATLASLFVLVYGEFREGIWITYSLSCANQVVGGSCCCYLCCRGRCAFFPRIY